MCSAALMESHVPLADHATASSGSTAQIELEAEAICDLFHATLEADQVARCGNNIGLPSVSMILANNDFHTSCADLAFDHTGELHGTTRSLTTAKLQR